MCARARLLSTFFVQQVQLESISKCKLPGGIHCSLSRGRVIVRKEKSSALVCAGPPCPSMAKNGPKSWSAAKMRQKRPQTASMKAAHEQKVGRLPRQIVSRPERPQQSKQPGIKKKKPSAPLQDNEKRLRALNKLLREIEALQAKEAAGEELDEQQQTKLDRLDEVLSEMEELMGAS